MASEPFLINPPERLRKKSYEGFKLHRPRVYEGKGHHMFTSSRALIVPRGMKLNPMGEELMFIGANPFKKGKEVRHMAKRRHHRSSALHLFGNPFHKRRRHHRKSYSMNPRHHRRHRRHYASNPMIDKSMIGMILAGGVGALATRMIPNLFKLTGVMAYLAQAGVLIAGGMGANKLLSKNSGTGFMIGAGSVIISDVAKSILPGATTGVSGYEYAPSMGVLPSVQFVPDSDQSIMTSGPYQNTLSAYSDM